MKHGRIINIPKKAASIRRLFSDALHNCYLFSVDEKAANGTFTREPSTVSYAEAMQIFLTKGERVHWTILYRDQLFKDDQLYWEFGACTLARESDIFIWIRVRPEVAQSIFTKHNLTINWY
jgi:hypothetical protein